MIDYFRKYFLIILILFNLLSCISKEEADLIVHNTTIYTVDGAFSTVEAMAIKDGKVVATGPEREILNKFSAKEMVDARKRPVYPGFIDGHCHFLGYGLSLQQVNLMGTTSFQEVLKRVKAFTKNNPEQSGWITGRGWDQNDWENTAFPDKEALDSLFPDRPILLKRVDGHAALANSKALEKAGITTATQVEGGIIEQKNGTLTGILIDNAITLVSEVIPEPSEEVMYKALLDAQSNCFAGGLTTVDDAGLDKKEVELIDRLQKNDQLKMRVYTMLLNNQENLDYYLESGPYKTDRLNVRSFKFYADGALGSRGACLLQPYADIIETEHYGILMNEPEYYRKYAQKLYDLGFQMNTHCIGDSANRLLLDVYGAVLKGTNDRRWRIEHAQIVHPDDLDKFSKYNIIPSVQPLHATSDMYWAEDRLGPERISTAYAFKDLMEQNGMLALGTDFPVEDINPLLTFYAAIARKDLNGFPEQGFQMENALERKEALRGITIWPAIANFEEQEKGSLEPGKFADFVILDRDIMEIPEELIPDVQVIATFLNGEKVFERK